MRDGDGRKLLAIGNQPFAAERGDGIAFGARLDQGKVKEAGAMLIGHRRGRAFGERTQRRKSGLGERRDAEIGSFAERSDRAETAEIR